MPADGAAPAVFVGHGSPMNALERNRYTEAWRALGAAMPKPRGVVAVSAHWYINATAVTAMARPRTIHDFYGFPEELFAFQYPAPGSEEIAGAVVDAAKPIWVGADRDSWGLDHGTWSVLAHMFPEADVPIVQLSVNAMKPPWEHLELGRRLESLRHQGIVVVASGNIVHNLRQIDWRRPEGGEAWAEAFDREARTVLSDAPGDLSRLEGHPDFERAAPTPDHFLPLLYLAGLAAEAGERPEVIVEGCVFGSISMTSYAIGSVTDHGESEEQGSPEAAPLPDPGIVPPDDTNL
jgi:4,5-DOPA dioxygenase extradiol